MDKLSVIYVNYYCLDDILNSIKTIGNNNNIEIIIVSNSPVDHKYKKKLEKEHVQLKILDDNYGFGFACNVGAGLANGDYLFFVNPDIIFKNDVINILKATLADSRIAAVGPRHLTPNGKCEPSVKSDLSYLAMVRWLFPFLKYLFPFKIFYWVYCPSTSQAVDVINGSAMLIKKEIFDCVGGFDTNFFMYWEENDLCLRIRKLGYLVYYEIEAEVFHKGQVTTSKNIFKQEIIKHRSQKYYVLKHIPRMLILNRIVGSITYLIRFIIASIFQSEDKVRQFKTLANWYIKEYS